MQGAHRTDGGQASDENAVRPHRCTTRLTRGGQGVFKATRDTPGMTDALTSGSTKTRHTSNTCRMSLSPPRL